jgi:autotransporter-associated beta strand protein
MLRDILRRLRVLTCVLAGVALCAGAARAQDATWLTSPGSNNFDSAANWNPNTAVPAGTAFFGASGTTSLTFSTDTTIGGWTFNAGASRYTFNNSRRLTFNGAGIVVNGGSASIDNSGGVIEFHNTSTAGNAAITNNSGSVIGFNDSSTAGSAIITNNFTLLFGNSSTAGSASITNNDFVGFSQSSSAGNATITNNFSGLGGLEFDGTSTAGSAVIINTSAIAFTQSSTAGSAAITNNSGGVVDFFNLSTAGNAAITNNAGGVVDFSPSSGPLGNHQLSAGSIGGAGNFYLGSNQLTVGGNNASTIVSGVISDCGTGSITCMSAGATGGSLVKVGTGTLTLSGDNTYTGATLVNGGVLDVTGVIANSDVTVNSGGVLYGSGSVSSLTVASGGIFAPGNGTPGTSMTVAGNLSFASGASYVVYLNPTTASFATVTGNTTLNGMVNANFATGGYLNKQYLILQSAGLSGTFAGVTNSNLPSGFTDSLKYTANDVFLNLTAALGSPSTPGASSPQNLNVNQQNVATALNRYFNNGGTLPPNFVNVFGLTGGSLGNALSQLDGEAATGGERAAFQLGDEFLTLMLDPFVHGRTETAPEQALNYAPQQSQNLPPEFAFANASMLKAPRSAFTQHWTAWGAAYGGTTGASGDGATGSSNLSAQTYGSALGMDYHVTPSMTFGFALAGAGTNWGLTTTPGSGHSVAMQAGFYGINYWGAAYAAGAFDFTNHWFTTNRIALGDQLNANFAGQNYGGRFEAGYRLSPLPRLGVTPYAAVQVQDFSTPSYSENDVSGGGFGLSYAATNATDVRSEVGGRFDVPTLLAGMPIVVRGRLAYAHDFVSNPALSPAFESLPGAAFTVYGAPIPHDSALVSAGAELVVAPSWTLLAKFDGEFANRSESYAGTGTLRHVW